MQEEQNKFLALVNLIVVEETENKYKYVTVISRGS